MLRAWSAGASRRSKGTPASTAPTARERLKALIALYSERMNTEGMAVELGDPAMGALRTRLAANAVASVDCRRG
jgi:hypothetical protein